MGIMHYYAATAKKAVQQDLLPKGQTETGSWQHKKQPMSQRTGEEENRRKGCWSSTMDRS